MLVYLMLLHLWLSLQLVKIISKELHVEDLFYMINIIIRILKKIFQKKRVIV